MTTVLLVRHGETTWNDERRLQGWAPVGLNDRGQRQAAAVADHLAREHDPDRLVASDLQRTRETAAAIEDALDLEATHDRAWRERGVGVLRGEPYERLFDDPELSVHHAGTDAVDRAPEDGESLVAVRDRVLAGFDGLRESADDGETSVVVTHGGPIAFLLGHLKGMDLVESIGEHSIENCAISELRVAGGTVAGSENPAASRADDVTVVRENVTAWRE